MRERNVLGIGLFLTIIFSALILIFLNNIGKTDVIHLFSKNDIQENSFVHPWNDKKTQTHSLFSNFRLNPGTEYKKQTISTFHYRNNYSFSILRKDIFGLTNSDLGQLDFYSPTISSQNFTEFQQKNRKSSGSDQYKSNYGSLPKVSIKLLVARNSSLKNTDIAKTDILALQRTLPDSPLDPGTGTLPDSPLDPGNAGGTLPDSPLDPGTGGILPDSPLDPNASSGVPLENGTLLFLLFIGIYSCFKLHKMPGQNIIKLKS